MAIQMRRGAYAEFDPSKMKAGEWAVSTDYDTDGTGYIEIPNSTPSGTSGGYIKDMLYTALGMFPTSITGSSSTYYPDSCWFNNKLTAGVAHFGASLQYKLFCGAFSVVLHNPASKANWDTGTSLSYK